MKNLNGTFPNRMLLEETSLSEKCITFEWEDNQAHSALTELVQILASYQNKNSIFFDNRGQHILRGKDLAGLISDYLSQKALHFSESGYVNFVRVINDLALKKSLSLSEESRGTLNELVKAHLKTELFQQVYAQQAPSQGGAFLSERLFRSIEFSDVSSPFLTFSSSESRLPALAPAEVQTGYFLNGTWPNAVTLAKAEFDEKIHNYILMAYNNEKEISSMIELAELLGSNNCKDQVFFGKLSGDNFSWLIKQYCCLANEENLPRSTELGYWLYVQAVKAVLEMVALPEQTKEKITAIVESMRKSDLYQEVKENLIAKGLIQAPADKIENPVIPEVIDPSVILEQYRNTSER